MSTHPPADVADANASTVLAFKTYNFDFVTPFLQQFSLYYSKAKSFIYDAVILRMTEKWYRAVLNKLNDGSILLDVGIGTGGGSRRSVCFNTMLFLTTLTNLFLSNLFISTLIGALLRCIDLIELKNLKVIGIDIDSAYVEAGKRSVQNAGLSERVSIDKVNVYEGRATLVELAKKMGASVDSDGKFVDAVYFSGSFSLLPDPVKALQLVSALVKPKGNDDTENGEKGSIFITQTYQRRTPFFLPYVKPLMKYATTIDFGNLIREEDVLQTFKESGLEVVEHNVIPGSVDNSLQAAYLTMLR